MKETKDLYEFGSFRFDRRANTLWRENEPVSLSPKSLDLLKLLLERHGEIVSKQEIFDTVWAGTFVEDGVLTQNIYTLRQALGSEQNGKQIIENIARRGYRFTMPVSRPTKVISIDEGDREPTNSAITEDRISEPISRPAISRLFPALAALFVLLIIAAGFLAYRYNAGDDKSVSSAVDMKFTRLTDNGDVSYLTVSPNGNWVAYTRGFDLYVRDLRSGEDQKIKLENVDKVGCLQFSPDNVSIYFGTVYNRDEKGSVYKIAVAGGISEPVVSDVWSGFSISPNGQEIAFVRKVPAKNGQVLIIRNLSDGSEKTVATTDLPEEFYWNNYPAWSADGKKLAVVGVSQTEHFSRIVIVENGKQTDFKPQNFRNIEQIVWTASGDGFIASGNDGNNFQIWKIAVGDGSAKRITNDLNSYLGISASSDRKNLVSRQRIYYSNIWVGAKDDVNALKQATDGTSRNDGLNGFSWIDEERLVYASNDQKIRDWNLWLLNTTDGTRKKLTNDSDVQNDFPVASPDGQAIYFASDRNKQRRVWKIDADGNNLAQVTFGEDEAHLFPQISPDGTQLYFIIKSGRTSNIGRASLSQRSVQELSGKTKFVPGNFLSLSPDGKYLAFQNIASEVGGQQAKHQIAILSTENPDDVRFIEVDTLRPWATWSADNNSLDFISGTVKETSIMRRPLTDDVEPFQLSRPDQSSAFQFRWSKSGEKIAVSRGQLLRDVVLLTNFD